MCIKIFLRIVTRLVFSVHFNFDHNKCTVYPRENRYCSRDGWFNRKRHVQKVNLHSAHARECLCVGVALRMEKPLYWNQLHLDNPKLPTSILRVVSGVARSLKVRRSFSVLRLPKVHFRNVYANSVRLYRMLSREHSKRDGTSKRRADEGEKAQARFSRELCRGNRSRAFLFPRRRRFDLKDLTLNFQSCDRAHHNVKNTLGILTPRSKRPS